MVIVVNFIHRLIQLYILIIIVEVILSYFMSPFHPARQFIARLVEPALTPIRRLLSRATGSALGAIDFSPLVLIILLQILDMLVINILLRF
jgi:YggT family protein